MLRRRSIETSPTRSSPNVNVSGSQQLGSIGLSLPRALKFAEDIPGSADTPTIRHRTGRAVLVAVDHI